MFYRKIFFSWIVFLFFFLLAMGQERGKVQQIEFSGNKTIKDQRLENQMNTVDANLQEKLLFWQDKPRFSRTILEDDMQRLRSFYQRQGFLGASLDYSIQDKKNNGKLTIMINIQEGEPVIVQSVEAMEPAGAKQIAIYKDVIGHLPVEKGDRFVDNAIFSSEETLANAYKNKGFPFVRIQRDIQLHQETKKASIHFNVFPGQKAYFGPTTVQGNSYISKKYIRDMLQYQQGDVYSSELVYKTQQKIFYTDMFRYAVISTREDSMTDHQVPMMIKVKELPRYKIIGGIGYGIDDRFRVKGEFVMLNFLGGARKLILEGKHSYFVPVRFDIKIIQPYLFASQFHLMENPFYLHQRERSYEVKRLGNMLTLQKQFSPDFTGHFNYIFEKVSLLSTTGSLEVLDGYDGSHDKSGFTIGARWNTADDIFNPSGGVKLNAYTALMGIGFRSEYHYHKTEFALVKYHQLVKEWILAGRGKLGYIVPFRGTDTTPLEERFLAGGANSLRGWGRHEIALVNKGGQVGGNSFLEANLELRFPIYRILHGAAFMDAGNVWREAFYYSLNTLRYNLGAGIRVNTPVGPIRLDLARPVLDAKTSWQFFLSIGHAF